MLSADEIIQAVVDANARLTTAPIRATYAHLIGQFEAHLTSGAFEREARSGALTETQITLLRYGLRHLEAGGSPAYGQIAMAAADVVLALRGIYVHEPPAEAVDFQTEPSADPPTFASPARRFDVVIAYHRRNGNEMRRLRADLNAHDFVVWTDEGYLPGTPEWTAALAEVLPHARSLIVLLSADAKKSEWVNKQIFLAKGHDVPVFPLLIKDDERKALPSSLAGHACYDGRRERDYRLNMQKITRAIEQLQQS